MSAARERLARFKKPVQQLDSAAAKLQAPRPAPGCLGAMSLAGSDIHFLNQLGKM